MMNQRTFGRRQATTVVDANRAVRPGIIVFGIGALLALAICTAVLIVIGSNPKSDAPAVAEALLDDADVSKAEPGHWVTTQRLARYTCASSACGVVGEFFYRQGVDLFEERDGFARITKFYDASCVGGKSEYVDSGPSSCVANNGIVDGKFAEWVEVKALSTERPADPGEGEPGLLAHLGGSDDFLTYRLQFLQGAEKMIASGLCTREQIANSGGFLASMNLKPRRAYWLFCDDQRVYLDVATGEVWRR